MRSERILAGVTLGTMALVAMGCSQAAPPAFSDKTGEGTVEAVAYPEGPFGISPGSIIPNYNFVGYADPHATQATMQSISLADFYNPHGKDATYQPASPEEDDRLFPADSPYEYAGKAKPTVLLIDIASVWCVPCNEEAGTILPMKHDLYAACGGEFLLDLHDSGTPGTTATPKNLQQWTTKYKISYPAAIDPSYQLDKLFSVDAYPSNVVIDTTTMKVVASLAGEVIAGVCDDNQTICGSAADMALCSDTSKYNCGLSTCPSGSCNQFSFWTQFESLLDKSRTGCTIK